MVIFVLLAWLSIETASFAKLQLLLAENRHRAGQRALHPIAAVHDLTGLGLLPLLVVALLPQPVTTSAPSAVAAMIPPLCMNKTSVFLDPSSAGLGDPAHRTSPTTGGRAGLLGSVTGEARLKRDLGAGQGA